MSASRPRMAARLGLPPPTTSSWRARFASLIPPVESAPAAADAARIGQLRDALNAALARKP
ncbi:MAG: hypothetical protein WB800_25535 [Streptosporangiaceae bacterium]